MDQMDRNGHEWTKVDLNGLKEACYKKHFGPFRSIRVHFGPFAPLKGPFH